MLHTNLEHILSKDDFERMVNENENVMICCGRMGPMCIPVYSAMSELKGEYENVKFVDFEFDHPDAALIRNAPEAKGFMGLPFTFYYKNGKTVAATSSVQSNVQIKAVLDQHFK